MPEIRKLKSVSAFATPTVWKVETDRGETAFTLRGEEDIRRLNAQTLLIADNHGIFYLIRDLMSLDKPAASCWIGSCRITPKRLRASSGAPLRTGKAGSAWPEARPASCGECWLRGVVAGRTFNQHYRACSA